MSREEAFKLFGDVQAAINHNDKLVFIQKRDEAQKNLLDEIVLAELAEQRKQFFNWILEFWQRKNFDPSQWLDAAKKSGFSNTEEALNLARNSAGQSPLQQAFQTQKFDLAQQLLSFGAVAGPVESAAFEIALDSKAAKKFGFTPEYLPAEKLHPVKDFGLVLGIVMTAKDGTFSQFGHIAPTYKIMADAVSNYAKNELDNPHFDKIAQAFDFSHKAAAFSQSTSQNDPAAGREIAARIQKGEITTIPFSCAGHAMGLSVVPDDPPSKSGYMVVTNRGLGKSPSEEGTQIYRIDDLGKIDANFINASINGHANGASHAEIMAKIHEITENQPPIHAIKQKDQKSDNCTIANTRSNIHGILACQKAKEKGGFDKLTEADLDSVKKDFKKFTKHMRQDKVDTLAQALQRNPQDHDLNKLAKTYLEGHPNAATSLREPIEKALKSAAGDVFQAPLSQMQ